MACHWVHAARSCPCSNLHKAEKGWLSFASVASPVIRQWLVETGLRGWACKTRTQKCRHKLSLCKSAQISGDPAEFWPQRLLAFELRRWGNAARASCCRDLQQALCAEVAIERHRKARIGRGFCRSKDAPPAAKPAIPLRTLRWTLGAKRACVVIKDIEPDRLAPLAPPAPIGLRGVWVVAARLCAGTIERSVVCPSANLRGPVRHGLHPR